MARALNVLGQPLQSCSLQPRTGFLRSGCCDQDPRDPGEHWVCAEMTAAFLRFSQQRGNDLSTPRPEFGFAGLKPGDRWCLCANRWLEALVHKAAPRIFLASTHEAMLEKVSLETLVEYAADLPPPR